MYSNILQSYTKLNYFKNYFNLDLNDDTYCLSLSGGVDSMVLLDILYKLNKKIIAIHINYNNREESKLEENFLKQYCLKKNIIFLSYSFDFKRGSIKRSVYESKTKKIKFEFYKSVLDNYNLKSILLAHHKDDIIENIFTNFCRGENFLNLSVIKYSNEIMGVNIIRPLLNYYKYDIYNYAHYNEIPYFLDTTPKWSIRGKFRNNILKTLITVFPGFKNNLLYIAQESDEWSKLINDKIISKYFSLIIYYENYIRLPLKVQNENYSTFPLCFWTTIFAKIFHNIYNINCPSRKSIKYVVECINKQIKTKIILNKNKIISINKDYIQINN